MSAAYTLTERAVAQGEIDSLLLGESDYACFPRGSYTGLKTNPVVLLRDGLYPYAFAHPEYPMRERLEACLAGWGDYLLGIATTALILCVETRFARDRRYRLGLDLTAQAATLMESIRRNRPALRAVQAFGGRGFPDGMIGNLRALSLFAERQGGPAFFPPEVKLTLRKTGDQAPYAHLEPLVETLIAAGNKRMHPEPWITSRYHWTCFLRRRIDFELVRKSFVLPETICLDEQAGSIFDSQGFIEIAGGRD